MQDEIERKVTPPQEPVVPPHGCRDRGTTEPLDVPPAGRLSCSVRAIEEFVRTLFVDETDEWINAMVVSARDALTHIAEALEDGE